MYKNALIKYLIMVFSVSVVSFLWGYLVDPYMFFHKKIINKEQMFSNMRIQNYGLIKFGNFDSIIMGTSMLENTSANEASEKLGSEFVNLSFPSATFYERFLMLNLAYKEKNIKHVIYSLDYKFEIPQETHETFDSDLYEHENLLSKFEIYITNKALECIFLNKCNDMKAYDLDHPNEWASDEGNKKRFGGFDNWIKVHEINTQIQDAFSIILDSEKTYENMHKNYKQIIDTELMPLFLHKDVQYSIVVPPYHILWWTKRKAHLDESLEPFVYLIKKTADLPNVNIYWFYDDNYSGNIAEYKDLVHYHEKHNSMQIDAIKNKTNIISEKNYQAKLERFKKKIISFNVEKYSRKIPLKYASANK